MLNQKCLCLLFVLCAVPRPRTPRFAFPVCLWVPVHFGRVPAVCELMSFPFVSQEGALLHPACPCPSHSPMAGGILCGLHRMSITFVYCTRRTIISPSFNEQVPVLLSLLEVHPPIPGSTAFPKSRGYWDPQISETKMAISIAAQMTFNLKSASPDLRSRQDQSVNLAFSSPPIRWTAKSTRDVRRYLDFSSGFQIPSVASWVENWSNNRMICIWIIEEGQTFQCTLNFCNLV